MSVCGKSIIWVHFVHLQYSFPYEIEWSIYLQVDTFEEILSGNILFKYFGLDLTIVEGDSQNNRFCFEDWKAMRKLYLKSFVVEQKGRAEHIVYKI